ncbi:phage N-6-adenine-methyltransferase, partial [Escherichia coli]
LPSEIMIWQPEFTDKILSRKPGAVHPGLFGQQRVPVYRLQEYVVVSGFSSL